MSTLNVVIQFGVILSPIWIYQLLTSRKPFTQLPGGAIVMGLYGGIAAVADQLFPIQIFGITENFQSVPIILAIFYGKRPAGIVSVCLLTTYDLVTGNQYAWAVLLAIAAYSTIPYILCHRFDNYSLSRRLRAAAILCLVTLLIEIATIFALYAVVFGQSAWYHLLPVMRLLYVAAPIQFALMFTTMIILENMVEDGRLRQSLIDSQQHLKASEARYRSLVQYNPLGVCAFDREGKYLLVNTAYEQMSGYTADELIGQSRYLLWFLEDHARAAEDMCAVLNGQVTEGIETSLRHKSGSRVTIRYTNVPMIVDNEIIGYYSIVTDITELVVAEERLRKSEKLATVGQLAAGVAHEIRNPLTSLKGFLKLIEQQTRGLIRQDYISIMQSELGRIDLISSELLVLGKPQADQFRAYEINPIIKDVTTLIEAQANMSNVRIVTALARDLDPVWCEENQIKQVFINVIKNAIDAMPTGGTVSIYTEMADSHVIVTIQDTGTGISADMLDHLGEPFYTTKGTGTGLGLMVTHQIIQRHGGTIQYDSLSGQGTTVKISFQAAMEAVEGTTQPAVEMGAESAS